MKLPSIWFTRLNPPYPAESIQLKRSFARRPQGLLGGYSSCNNFDYTSLFFDYTSLFFDYTSLFFDYTSLFTVLAARNYSVGLRQNGQLLLFFWHQNSFQRHERQKIWLQSRVQGFLKVQQQIAQQRSAYFIEPTNSPIIWAVIALSLYFTCLPSLGLASFFLQNWAKAFFDILSWLVASFAILLVLLALVFLGWRSMAHSQSDNYILREDFSWQICQHYSVQQLSSLAAKCRFLEGEQVGLPPHLIHHLNQPHPQHHKYINTQNHITTADSNINFLSLHLHLLSLSLRLLTRLLEVDKLITTYPQTYLDSAFSSWTTFKSGLVKVLQGASWVGLYPHVLSRYDPYPKYSRQPSRPLNFRTTLTIFLPLPCCQIPKILPKNQRLVILHSTRLPTGSRTTTNARQCTTLDNQQHRSRSSFILLNENLRPTKASMSWLRVEQCVGLLAMGSLQMGQALAYSWCSDSCSRHWQQQACPQRSQYGLSIIQQQMRHFRSYQTSDSRNLRSDSPLLIRPSLPRANLARSIALIFSLEITFLLALSVFVEGVLTAEQPICACMRPARYELQRRRLI